MAKRLVLVSKDTFIVNGRVIVPGNRLITGPVSAVHLLGAHDIVVTQIEFDAVRREHPEKVVASHHDHHEPSPEIAAVAQAEVAQAEVAQGVVADVELETVEDATNVGAE